MKKELNSFSYEQLEKYIIGIGEKKFRVNQLYDWMHGKMVADFDEMTNLSKNLKEKLCMDTKLVNLEIVKKLESKEDSTAKYLFRLEDDNIIESVFMKYNHGNSVCISSQVGCRMGCKFCASTIGGLTRNLSNGEMLQQIYAIQKDVGEKITNVVIMGSGEPLENYSELILFLNNINDERGQNIGLRNITVSTCGLTDKIKKLAEEKYPITLAISLHAPNDKIRNEIMPISRKNDYEQLINACRYYLRCTNRRITFEYALIKGVNDSDTCAYELATKLKGLLCHVNLIPVNSVKEKNYIQSTKTTIKKFQSILETKGIVTTVRRELGSDINAACGQLRKSYLDK